MNIRENNAAGNVVTGLKAALYSLMVLLISSGCASGEFVTELWGNAPSCHHRDTMKVGEGRVVEFDLSALPDGVRVQRAVLKAEFQRRDYRLTIRVCPLQAGQNEAPDDAPELVLRPPWYRDFDATQAVRACVRAGRSPLRLHFKSAPGWQSRSTVLEIAYAGKADEPTPPVAGLQAVHHDGQTFLTWREHQDILGEDPVTLEKLEQKLLPLRDKQQVVYRVYAHDSPITLATLPEATLVAEVPFVLSAYYLDSVPTIEHPNPQHGEGATPFIGGARARRHPVPRYVIAKDQPPLERGSGLYVRTITKDASTYYAVITAVNGREAVREGGLGAGNSLQQPVAEKVAPPIPVRQSDKVVQDERTRKNWVVTTYNYWLEFPYANVPRQLQTGSRHRQDMPRDGTSLLWVQLGAYGSQPIFNANERGGGDAAVCPPWDQDDSILQGRHECLETLRSYDQGVVHNWGQRRALALATWGQKDFGTDPQRVVVEGQFSCWALRHPDVFASVIGDAYANFNKGREAQKHGPTWGPYPQGSKNSAGADQWDYMNISKYIRENPTVELPFYVSRPTGSSHVGDIGPWAWAEMFRALHDTKRAFTARWGGAWAGSPPAGAMVGQIRKDQSLPAFGNCSLDDCPGDGELNPGGVGGDGDPTGNINGYLFWDTTDIVDEPGRWEMTVYLPTPDREGRGGAPADSCTTDMTPRRCRKFKGFKPGEKFTWTNTSLKDNKVVQTGPAEADPWGLVTVKGLIVTTGKNRITITK